MPCFRTATATAARKGLRLSLSTHYHLLRRRGLVRYRSLWSLFLLLVAGVGVYLAVILSTSVMVGSLHQTYAKNFTTNTNTDSNHASPSKAAAAASSLLLSRIQRTKEQQEPPCRVAVTNSVPTHYETLESVAALLPLKYLSFAEGCNTKSLVFDYHILADEERYKSWATYFETAMKGVDMTTTSPEGDVEQGGITKRRIGTLTLHEQLPKNGIITPDGYDAIIEASCYCRPGTPVNHPKWLQKADGHRSCIFHEKCPKLAHHPWSLWPSPHHEHYYLPLALPKQPIKPPPTANETLSLCVVGGINRRNWGFLQHYLDKQKTPWHDFRIQILGFGDFPKELEPYKRLTSLASPEDYQEFHKRVAQECDAILMLVSQSTHPNYFFDKKTSQQGGTQHQQSSSSSSSSLLKLSGALPLIIAYHKPAVMHRDLYQLYQPHLPNDLLVATHTDDPETFHTAMQNFIPNLRAKRQQPQSREQGDSLSDPVLAYIWHRNK